MRLEVVDERENGRAGGRHARGEGAPSPLACLLLARAFFLVPTTSKRLGEGRETKTRAVIKRRGPGFSPGYFQRKVEEKEKKKKPLAVWFPAYLLYFPSNIKS